ncbi:lipopolysaccharide export system permease protein [Rubritalea squalenifaciens DSM 18772]|uniref:Lipopolysaccharide export system permease protein n=1 Tax=Rubritalea squalenifaciens DSM 18772 TaxID=1123071 RepID=A0A1M6MC75_9BACT|nr:LptF/LptG family permease [Rubritalea squalenifaciens]SHJ81086.1 lipopolysaccharide export system permease protein [Rubritalea squalenifaciens DSM 18772]
MLIADRHVGKQILGTTVFAVIILSGVFLLGNIFKEARPLFVGKHPSPFLVFQFILSVLPFSLMFTIPFSFLAAVMLVFGRLSADNEIVAMRMAGRSIPRIAAPVFVIGALLSALCFWLNVEVAPRSKANVKNILLEAVKEDPNKFLDPGVVQTQLENKRIYVRDRKGDTLYGVHIHDIGNEQNGYKLKSYIYAEQAELFIDMVNNELQLKLVNATMETVDKNGTRSPVSIGEVEPVIFNFKMDSKKRVRASYLSNKEIAEYLKENPDLVKKKRVDFVNEVTHRRSFSLACLAFALIGVPLGIGARRRETSTGFALSLGIGLCYFLFHIFANQSKDANTTTAILYWMPNVLALVLGIILFRRARSR